MEFIFMEVNNVDVVLNVSSEVVQGLVFTFHSWLISALFKRAGLFGQFGSYHFICSNKQLIRGSMKFLDDSTAGGNKTPRHALW